VCFDPGACLALERQIPKGSFHTEGVLGDDETNIVC
jgi:hypothetical protein